MFEFFQLSGFRRTKKLIGTSGLCGFVGREMMSFVGQRMISPVGRNMMPPVGRRMMSPVDCDI